MRQCNIRSIIQSLFCAVALCSLSSSALAELGGSAATIESDRLQMKGSVRISAQANYSVHEIQLSAGTLVREYVTPSGVVFGIAWRGPVIPDLRQLLGPYFTQYVELAKTQHSRHGRMVVQNDRLVVHSSGHMRAFFGRAYIPQLVPADVTIDDIK